MTNRLYLSGIKPLRSRPLLAIALAASVAVLPCAEADAREPSTNQPSTASTDVVRVNVVLMVVAEDDQAEIEVEFRERQFPQFASEHGLLEVGTNGEPELTVRLEIVQLDEGQNTYMINSTALYHDEVDTEPKRVCFGCSPADAVTDALSNVKRAAAVVIEHRAQYESEPDEATASVESAPPADAPRVRTLGAASYVGISASALGIGSAIAGVVLFERGKVLQSDPGSVYLEWIDYRPPGAALLGVGLGAMVVGSVLIGVDLGVLLPRRRARSQARVDGVSAMTERPGVVVTGRF